MGSFAISRGDIQMHPCSGPEHPKQEYERSTAFVEQPSSDLHDASPVSIVRRATAQCCEERSVTCEDLYGERVTRTGKRLSKEFKAIELCPENTSATQRNASVHRDWTTGRSVG